MALESKTRDFIEKAKAEGNLVYLDEIPGYYEEMREMNKQLERNRREYRLKAANSEREAEKCFFTD